MDISFLFYGQISRSMFFVSANDAKCLYNFSPSTAISLYAFSIMSTIRIQGISSIPCSTVYQSIGWIHFICRKHRNSGCLCIRDDTSPLFLLELRDLSSLWQDFQDTALSAILKITFIYKDYFSFCNAHLTAELEGIITSPVHAYAYRYANHR